VRIDFTQTITSGSRLRYILRNGNDTANVSVLDDNLSSTYANGSGSFFYYLKIDDGLQVRILSETNVGTLDSFTSTLTQNGDFQFSRGSDATRINSEGLVESVQVLSDELVQNGDFEEIGSELVTNGGFDTDSDWSNTSGGEYNISNGKLNLTNASYGTNSGQTNVTAIGKIYRVSYEVSNYEKGGVRFFAGGGVGSIQTSDGTYVEFVEASSNTSVGFQALDGGGTTLSIDNVSVKEVGQNWTFGGGWSVEDDEGNLRLVSQNGANYVTYQPDVFENGKKYRISFDVTEFISGQFQVRFHTADPFTVTSEGSYVVEGVANGEILYLLGFDTFNGKVDNFSVVEITDDTDVPRLDYSDGCPTLLLEPLRRNLLPYSEDFTEWDTSAIAPILTSGFSSPDNGTIAYKIAAGVGNGSHAIYDYPSVTFPVSTTYTFSVFAKKGEYKNLFLRAGASDAASITFDLDTFEFIQKYEGVAPITDYSIKELKDGWAKISYSYTTAASSANFVPNIIFYPDSGATINTTGCSFTGDGVSGGYIYGAQLEDNGSLGAATYPTSYIPTNGSSVTRLADVCNNAGDSTIFNDDEGVFYAEVSFINGETSQGEISLSAGNSTNSIRIIFNQSIGVWFYIQGQVDYRSGISIYNNNKIAFKYKNNDCSFWINGSKLSIDSSVTIPNGFITTQFDNGSGANPFYGKARSILYFNEALSDAELEYITSSDIDVVLQNNKLKATMLGDTYEDGHVEDRLNELF
jgi:hypothetical protein